MLLWLQGCLSAAGLSSLGGTDWAPGHPGNPAGSGHSAGKRPWALVEAAHQGRHVLSVALQVGISAFSVPPTSCLPGD